MKLRESDKRLIKEAEAEESLSAARRTAALRLGLKQTWVSRDDIWAALDECGLVTDATRRGLNANLVKYMRGEEHLFSRHPEPRPSRWKLTAQGRHLAKNPDAAINSANHAQGTRKARAQFKVYGPITIPLTVYPAARKISDDAKRRVWRQHADLANAHGVYVFGLRAGGGIVPWYVGMTSAESGFQGETFTDHKRNKYDGALARVRRGTPVMYLIYATSRVSRDDIGEVESWAIVKAAKRNPKLLNLRKTGTTWDIAGVTSGVPGKPTDAARVLRRVLGV